MLNSHGLRTRLHFITTDIERAAKLYKDFLTEAEYTRLMAVRDEVNSLSEALLVKETLHVQGERGVA